MGNRIGLAFVLLVTLLSCQAPRDDASRLASTLRDRGSMNAPSRRMTLSAEETTACFEGARALQEADRPAEALGMLERACDRGTSGPHAGAVRELRSSLRRRHEMADLGLNAWVAIPEYDFESGDIVRGRLIIENGGRHVVRLAAGVDGFPFGWFGRSESSRLLIEGRRLDYDPYGSEVGESWRETLEIEDHIVLRPGQRWERSLELPIEPEPRFVVREFTIGARLFATTIEAGGQVHPAHGIEFAEARFVAFLPGYRQVLSDPLGSLQQALSVLDGRTDLHALVAAHLMSPQDTPEAVEVLINALRAQPPVRRRYVIMVGLRQLTGQRLALDEQRWLGWWRHLQEPMRESSDGETGNGSGR